MKDYSKTETLTLLALILLSLWFSNTTTGSEALDSIHGSVFADNCLGGE